VGPARLRVGWALRLREVANYRVFRDWSIRRSASTSRSVMRVACPPRARGTKKRALPGVHREPPDGPRRGSGRLPESAGGPALADRPGGGRVRTARRPVEARRPALREGVGRPTRLSGTRIDCGQGHQAEFQDYRSRALETTFGRIRWRRAYYWCSLCHRGIFPAEQELGMRERPLTPALDRLVAHASQSAPFVPARDLPDAIGGIQLNAKRVERRARRSALPSRPAWKPVGRHPWRPHPGPARGAGRSALPRPRRHPDAHGQARTRRPRRPGRGRLAPHPRGQDRLRVHPDQVRRRGLAGARS
jgi:hypothetical protein